MLNLLNPLELKNYLRSKLASDEDTTGKKSGWKTNENGQHYHIGENGEIDAGMGGKLDGVNPSEGGSKKSGDNESKADKLKNQVAEYTKQYKQYEEQGEEFKAKHFKFMAEHTQKQLDDLGGSKASVSPEKAESVNNALSQIGTNKTDPEPSVARSSGLGEMSDLTKQSVAKFKDSLNDKSDEWIAGTLRGSQRFSHFGDEEKCREMIDELKREYKSYGYKESDLDNVQDYKDQVQSVIYEHEKIKALQEELAKRGKTTEGAKPTAQSAPAEVASSPEELESKRKEVRKNFWKAFRKHYDAQWAELSGPKMEKVSNALKEAEKAQFETFSDMSPEELEAEKERIRKDLERTHKTYMKADWGDKSSAPRLKMLKRQSEILEEVEKSKSAAKSSEQPTSVESGSEQQEAPAAKKVSLSDLTPAQIQQRLNHHRSMLRKNADNPEKQAAIQKKIDALTGERQRRKGAGETPENAGTVSPQTTGTAKKVSLADLSPAQIQQRLNHHRSMLRKAGDNPEKQAAIQKKIDALTGERQRRKGGQTEAGGTPQAAAPKKVSLSELNPAQIQQRLNHHRQQLKKHAGNPDKVAEIQKKIDALRGERVKRRNAAYEEKNAAKRANDPLAQRRQRRQEQAAAQAAQPKENPVQKPESKPAQKPAAKPAQATGERQKPKAPPAPSVSSLNDKQRKGYEIAKRLFGNKEMTAEQMQKKINDAMLLSQDPRRDIASMKDSSIGEAAFFQEKLNAMQGKK